MTELVKNRCSDTESQRPAVGESGKRVLVCGGREYGFMPRGVRQGTHEWYRARERVGRERDLLKRTLSRLPPIALLIHGAARGADEVARLWAEKHGVAQQAYPANWYPNGRGGGLDKSAGPKRNQKMLDEGKPDLVIAFPGGTGTADMVSRARAAGIEVVEVPA